MARADIPAHTGQEALRWLAQFLDAAAAERGAAANTLAAYRRDLSDFAGWCSREGLSLTHLGRADIERYMVFCDAQGLAQATRARRLSAIRQLFRFAYDEGWRGDDPAALISGPGKGKRLPGTLSVDEVERLMDAAARTGRTDTERLRNRCLMELLYATGMRVSELVSLPIAAVQGDPRVILVRGKGGKERMVPLSDPARAALIDWLAVCEADASALRSRRETPSRFLFASRARSGHLTREGFFLLVKQIAVAAGVSPDKTSPHVLRHAFATHLLAGGADLRAIQTLLGHADVSSTEIYTHVLEERLKSLVLDHHPLAKN